MSNNSHNATPTTKSCFSGILRRLLCTGSLPTHPSDSDHLPDFDKTDFINYLPKKNEHEVQGGGGTVPGVVARLMGLDSLPAHMTWVPNKDSIHLRSRSVNSADYWSPLDLTAQESYRHRRVRTSASFREIPTTFLLCFDKNGDEQKTSRDEGIKMMAKVVAAAADDQVKRISKTKISTTTSCSGNKWNTKEKVVGVKKKKKKKKENDRENNKRKDVDLEPKRLNSSRVQKNNIVLGHNKSNDHVYVKSSTMKMKRSAAEPVNLVKELEVSGGMKRRAKQRVNRGRAKKVEPEHSSSSVESGKSGTMAFNPAKKINNSTPKVLVDKLYLDYPCVNSVRKSNDAAEVDFYVDKLALEVCRLTDEDTKASTPNNRPWISDQVIEFEHICLDFGQEILEMLLQQLVDELNL